MQDIAIHIENLSKVYSLYSSPLQMFLHKLGLTFLLRKKPAEHAALNNISLKIGKGEKVAFIGRNGAGKSTLLKLISGVSDPSFGTLKVNGEVHALLSIGSGFHQDFTGRENVYAYLANQGIAGKQADAMLEEIVEFAEVEEYIDQPLRTYSTGMGVRLMFATSTIVAPDVLILDEVLGVGDAYFAQKSYNRMKEMATDKGTTLLLVTHDIYSAVTLCERVIWIDKGKILIDGPAKEVVAAYENSVKIQEEERLRVKNLRKRDKVKKALGPAATSIDLGDELLVEIKPGNGMYFEAPFYLFDLELRSGQEILASWSAESADARGALILEGSQWGELKTVNSCKAQEVKDYGNPFHKVKMNLPIVSQCATGSELSCSLTVSSEHPLSMHLFFYTREKKLETSIVSIDCAGKRTVPTPLQLVEQPVDLGQVDFYGTAAIVLSNLRFVQRDREVLICEPGERLEILIDYEIKDETLDCTPDFAIVFHKDGLREVSRSLCSSLRFSYAASDVGTVRVVFPEFHLGAGEYTVSILVASPGYYENTEKKYFSINGNVYTCMPRAKIITVEGGSTFAREASVLVKAELSSLPRL